MNNDPRFCLVCEKLLLKQDRHGFVLVIRCDQCYHLVHERCYLEHHRKHHELIGIITLCEETELNSLYKRNQKL